MSNVYITFSGPEFDESTKLIVERARDFGADEVMVYDDRWLMKRTKFYMANRWIFDRRPAMGFGWCSWKPYIIGEELRHRQPGDVVLYTDADTYPIADLRGLFEHARQRGVMLFEEQGCNHRFFTRAECWRAMGVEPQLDTALACGRFQLFAAEWNWQPFLERWQHFSLDERCQFHEPNPEDREVIRHSAEQSVLSLVALDWKIPLHRTPDQAGWPREWNGTYKLEDAYPQVFVQAGTRSHLPGVYGSKYRNLGQSRGDF